MLAPFKRFISQKDLLDPGDRVLLAVSGGLDSMVMLNLFQETGYAIGVAHCNFQLRGQESADDEDFVRHYCSRFGIGFFSQGFETKNYAEASGLSVQMAARELRYGWFNQVMEDKKYHWLATAHHLDDNVETILLRWIKGAGLDQLRGIPLKNGKVIRPMLFATRAQILTYATSKKIGWREDKSNATDDYQRNFIRHQVIPKLKEINPSLEETFGTSIEKMNGAYELMQRGLGQLKDTVTKVEGHQFMIDKTLLQMLQHPAFVCYEWLRPFGFEWDRCVQLISALTAPAGKQFFSNTHRAVIDREFIIVTLREEWSYEILIEEGQEKATLGPWVLNIKSQAGSKIETGHDHGSFDPSNLRFPLLWRKWRDGDAFYPLGLGHRKKVSDFLIDEKVPLVQKNSVTVIVSAGEIVWVVGYRVDDRYKVRPQTQSVLHLQATPI